MRTINKLKSLLLFFVALSLSFSVFYGGYFVYSANADDSTNKIDEDFYKFVGKGDFLSASISYDQSLNNYFNFKMAKLVKIVNEAKDDGVSPLDNPNFSTPQGVTLENYKSRCTADNVSTFCVSMGAKDIFIQYVKQLKIYESDPIISRFSNAKEAITGIESQNAIISQEIMRAEKSLRAVVPIYDEFRLAYPVHREYETIIESLGDYRDALGDVGSQTQLYPFKFHDASTTECS